MSLNQSKSLLNDPSIIQISGLGSQDAGSQDAGNEASPNTNHLEPGSALSKLLDSAIAKAAKETTPDLEPKASIEFVAVGAAAPRNPINPDYIYSIEFLLSLRDSPHVVDYKDSESLPDKSFWRHKAKGNEFGSTGKQKKSNRRQHQNETWERKPVGFNRNSDLDSMSQDKISQLLGENADELEPEWDSADIANSNELGIDMGQTVEDFEKWKYQMKLEERRKNGEAIDEAYESESRAAEKAGNEVDNFFSFVKPKHDEIPHASIDSHSNQQTPKLAQAEKSSRFSSFFSTPSAPPVPRPEPEQPKEQANFSRFFSGPPMGESPTNPPHAAPVAMPHAPPPNLPLPRQANSISSQSSGQLPGIPKPVPATNDSFFMTLLNKKEPNGSESGLGGLLSGNQESRENVKHSPQPKLNQQKLQQQLQQQQQQHLQQQQLQQHQQHLQQLQQQRQQFPSMGQGLPAQSPGSVQGQPQQGQHQQGQHQQGQHQQGQHQQGQHQKPQQGENRQPPGQRQMFPPHLPQNGQQGQNQQLPPWMKQFQNGMPVPPPHMQYPPNMMGPGGPPPPGMFPNGYLPLPPGVPPAFNPNGPNGPNRNPNGPKGPGPNGQFIPPQYMGFPPGMVPPHLQNSQNPQQNSQQSQRR